MSHFISALCGVIIGIFIAVFYQNTTGNIIFPSQQIIEQQAAPPTVQGPAQPISTSTPAPAVDVAPEYRHIVNAPIGDPNHPATRPVSTPKEQEPESMKGRANLASDFGREFPTAPETVTFFGVTTVLNDDAPLRHLPTPQRTWTDSKGRQIQGIVNELDLDAQTVTITRSADQKRFENFSFGELSTQDQDYLLGKDPE